MLDTCNLDSLFKMDKLNFNVRMLVYSYTDSCARFCSKQKGFSRLASFSNIVFPKNFIKYCNRLDYKTALGLWKYEKRENLLVRNKYINRPSINYSSDPNHDYKASVFPNSHNTLEIWSLNDLRVLGSYSNKLVELGMTTIVFVKYNHIKKFRSYFRDRLLDHRCKDLENMYISYIYKKSALKKLDLDNQNKILCLPYNIGIIKTLYKKVNTFNHNLYILSPKDVGSKSNNILNMVKKFSYGSGVYNLTRA